MQENNHTADYKYKELSCDLSYVRFIRNSVRIFFLGLFSIAFIVISSENFQLGTKVEIAVGLGTLFFVFLLSLSLTNKLARLELQQDLLIFQYSNTTIYLTKIKSIKGIKSMWFGKFTLSRIVYQLDGVNRKALILWKMDKNLKTQEVIESLMDAA